MNEGVPEIDTKEVYKNRAIEICNREGSLLKNRLDSMLQRADTVGPKELDLMARTLSAANHKFSELSGSEEWIEALKESHR